MPLPRATVATGVGSLVLLVAAVLLHLHPLGLVQACLGSFLLVSSSAVALNASRVRPLQRRTALRAVLASTAANAVTPAGLGGSALVARLHARSGLTADETIAAITLRAVAAGVAGVSVATVAAATLGLPHRVLPGHVTLLAVGALLAGATVFALSCPLRRSTAARHLAATTAALAGVLKHPTRTAALLLGAVGVVGAQLLILDGAVRAVGGHAGLGPLLVALVGSSAARAAVPSPSGIGPVEAALLAGLAALGLPMAAAAIAVGLYRAAGLALPVLAGLFALRSLRREHLL